MELPEALLPSVPLHDDALSTWVSASCPGLISKCFNIKFISKASSPFFFLSELLAHLVLVSLVDVWWPSREFLFIFYPAFSVASSEAGSADSDFILAQHNKDLVSYYPFFKSSIMLEILHCSSNWSIYILSFYFLHQSPV